MKKKIIVPILLLTIALMYQNCSDVNLTHQGSIVQPEKLEALSLQAQICPSSEHVMTLNSKIIFIIDMSMSNLGTGVTSASPNGTVCIAGNNCVHTIVGRDQATDNDGERFNMVRSLVSGLAAGNADVFSIMGFHDQALNTAAESCDSGFVNAASAISAVDELNALQDYDKNHNPLINQNYNNPFKLRGTAYMKALDCVTSKLNYDINRNFIKSFYNIVFLTDGKASDSGDYASRIQNIFNSYRHDILGMKMYPIYYGDAAGEPDATALLNPMAHVLDPSINTYVSNNFSELKNILAQHLSSAVQLNYGLKTVGAINLTSFNKRGVLFTDSNMNGIADGETGDQASNIRAIVNSFSGNLNEDKDVIPSFLEVIRGLDPTVRDDFLDIDLDGQNNFEELSSGRDIFSHESDYPTPGSYLVKSKRSLDPQELCPNGQPVYRLDISQIPMVKDTLGYQDPSPGDIDFTYSAGENLIMVYYIAEPLNSDDLKPRIYVKLLRVPSNSRSNIEINTLDFQLMGEF